MYIAGVLLEEEEHSSHRRPHSNIVCCDYPHVWPSYPPLVTSDTVNKKQTPAMISKNKRPYDPADLAPNQRLRLNLANLYSRNELSGSSIGELARDINGVAPAELRDLARPAARPDNQTRSLRAKFLKRSMWMPDYIATLRTWDAKKQQLVEDKVPMQLMHEIVAVLLKTGFKEALMATDHMDPLTAQHLRHCEAQAGVPLLGIGMWGDGAPTQWDRNESIDVLSMSLPGIQEKASLRIPLVVLPHSRVCSETWEDVCAVIKWSLVCLATGVWPSSRHDGSAWDATDKCRQTARPLLRAALVEVRHDWKFASELFGFPAHNTKEGCCWRCTVTPQQVHGVASCRHVCS